MIDRISKRSCGPCSTPSRSQVIKKVRIGRIELDYYDDNDLFARIDLNRLSRGTAAHP